MENIYLVGFMGTGKTAIGKELSKNLGLKFIDIATCFLFLSSCAIFPLRVRIAGPETPKCVKSISPNSEPDSLPLEITDTFTFFRESP